LREGIRWVGVGQRDPLVEYRRQAQRLFEEMQVALRHDVARALFHARPVDESHIHQAVETELTKAARRSVDNADKIIDAADFNEEDFAVKPVNQVQAEQNKQTEKRRKARKAQRQNKKRAKSRKRK
jgi:preprotein translocase subunit SecA